MSFKFAQASATLGSSLFDQTLFVKCSLATSPGRNCIAGAEAKPNSAHFEGVVITARHLSLAMILKKIESTE